MFDHAKDIPLQDVPTSSLSELSQDESVNQESEKYVFNYSMHIPLDSLSK